MDHISSQLTEEIYEDRPDLANSKENAFFDTLPRMSPNSA